MMSLRVSIVLDFASAYQNPNRGTRYQGQLAELSSSALEIIWRTRPFLYHS